MTHLTLSSIGGARPVTTHTLGSPFQPGELVTVVASVEPPGSDMSVSEYIGSSGTVEYLEYSCGCGQKFPDDPMIGVAFRNGHRQEFWAEELRSGTT